MLKAYFDESGTHSSSKVVLLCGFVGKSEDLETFEIDWENNLRTSRVPYFHATDCENGKGDIYGALQEPLRKSLFVGLTDVICRHKLAVISCAILRCDWERYKSGDLGERFVTPYHLCFEMCMQDVVHWSDDNASGKSASLFFANQKEFEGRASEIYSLYSKNEYWGGKFSELKFMQAKDSASLQGADLLAYEAYQHLNARMTNPNYLGTARLRKLIESGNPMLGRLIDETQIVELLKQKSDKHL